MTQNFRRMKTLRIRLKGGLGNQLFQFATVTDLALRNFMSIHILPPEGSRTHALSFLGIEPDCTYVPSIKNNQLKYDCIKNRTLPILRKYSEKEFSYSKLPSINHNFAIEGYFQSFKYFEEIFTPFIFWIREVLSINQTPEKETVTLHIRLGDIARNQEFREIHGVLDSSYYVEALKLLYFPNMQLQAITDDPDLIAIEHPTLLKLYPDMTIICKSQELDFKLLASSTNLVIANSTFSWWAAAVSQGKVVAPRNWFRSELIEFVPADFYLAAWKCL